MRQQSNCADRLYKLQTESSLNKKMSQKIGNPSFTKTVKQTDAELVTVKCKGCGGINKIQRGAVGECEYCGSPISGE